VPDSEEVLGVRTAGADVERSGIESPILPRGFPSMSDAILLQPG
jgi:hypothetical protein